MRIAQWALAALCSGLVLAGCWQGSGECRPETEAELCSNAGHACGEEQLVDRCGSLRAVHCGECAAPSSCLRTAGKQVCRCQPETEQELCASAQAECGALEITDRCGLRRAVECGACPETFSCGFDVPNRCGAPCQPETDSELCAGQDHCGAVTATDRCGTQRNLECSHCGPGTFCGAFGDPEHCGRSACLEDGFCWEHPLPQGRGITDLWGTDSSNIWAAAYRGVLHWDGSRWSDTSLPDSSLHGIHGTSANDVWAVGAEFKPQVTGVIFHFDGSAWIKQVIPEVGTLESVWAASADDAWAVGADAVLSWDGVQWTKEADLAGSFARVWTDGIDVWVLGSDKSLLRRSAPGQWQSVQTFDSPAVGLWASSSSDLWVVGKKAQRWDGSQWTTHAELSLEQGVLVDVAGNAPNDVWAVGWSVAFHIRNGESTEIGPLSSEGTLHAVWPVAADDVWAAGQTGVLAHWDGTQWRSPPLMTDEAFVGIWQASEGERWAVGWAGTIAHFVDGTWSLMPRVTDVNLTGISGTSPTDIWVSGNYGTLLHWDGEAWSRERSPTQEDLLGVWAAAPDEVWVIEAKKIHHWAGGAWTSFDSPGPDTLSVVWGLAPDDVWAAGNQIGSDLERTVVHWDGERWLYAGCPTRHHIEAIWGTGPDNVWAGGWNGRLFRWNGRDWSDFTDYSFGHIYALCGRSADDIWGVTTDGAIHWDGTQWKRAATHPALDCAVSPAGVTTLVSGGAEILSRQPAPVP